MFEALAVLLVDDVNSIQMDLDRYRALEAKGRSVFAAGSGTEALGIFRQSRRPIDLMLPDIEMPGMSGDNLAKHALVLQPLMKTLFASGHAKNRAAHGSGVPGARRPLAKPFRRVALIRELKLALGC